MAHWDDGLDVESIARAARLQAMGITVRSVDLAEQIKDAGSRIERARTFVERGGNRAMRRAAARRAKRRGS